MYRYEFIDPVEMISSDDFDIVESFINTIFRKKIGWHYITDLIWIYRQAKHWPQGINILDAGGGSGPAQFLLAEMGFNITNIDLQLKTSVPYLLKYLYNFSSTRLESYEATDYSELLQGRMLSDMSGIAHSLHLKSILHSAKNYGKYIALIRNTWRKKYGYHNRTRGSIEYMAGNLCHLPEITDNSFSAVVSLSALEHIPQDTINRALFEIRRVLKKDAMWAITTSGTEKPDSWFHEPSKGWCFSDKDLKQLFNAQMTKKDPPEIILDYYKNCEYLKNNMADFYKKSGKLGMPWGIWKPQYIPVGITKYIKLPLE